MQAIFLGRRAAPAMAAALIFLVVLGLLYENERAYHLVLATLLPPPPRCNPYAQPGYLHISRDDPHANRWTTFGTGCPTPALMRALMAETSGVAGAHELGLENLDFARNRTVAVFGDSVQRYSMTQFCQMAGSDVTEVGADHPWLTGSGDWRAMPTGVVNKHGTHYCHVPQLDLVVVVFFFFGLDQEEAWIEVERNNPPYMFEDRVTELARPLLDGIGAARGHGARPDLVLFGSAMWDFARWMREDLNAGGDGQDALAPERAAWYRRRTREALLHLARVLPGAPLRYITSHYPLHPSNGWYYNGKHPDKKMNRFEPMHQAALSAVHDLTDATPEERAVLSNVGINHWGELLIGTEDYQSDDIHTTPMPGGYLWSDMLLYELRDAVEHPSV